MSAPRIATVLPTPLRGPHFGSYAPEEVGWLLTDLSGADLEADVAAREEAIQTGRAHYAESLPVEYQPSAAYNRLFRRSLTAGADRIAHDVGVVAELVLQRRDGHAVLISLARAGTPIGILIRRWVQFMHGVTLPHYAVSIVRGRGVDPVAMRYIVAHHNPADVMFVDGWTGKGAITRELNTALATLHATEGLDLPSELAVLADPGGCVSLYGSRDDFLIPSACLGSTVSGLISRTVLNTAFIGPRDFHGGKFYAEMAPADVSRLFLDSVTDRFSAVAAAVAHDVPGLATADRTPTWAGWTAVQAICERYDIDDVNLVKPGIGETTRVLLRRVPWKVLVWRDADAELDHVRLLAWQRGVPIEVVDDLPYRCVGLIRPHRAGIRHLSA